MRISDGVQTCALPILQAYLPDSLAALEQLMDFALRRRDAGGAGIKVRFVKGANLSMERVDAELHGWAQAPHDNKADVDASYLRLLDRPLVPELSGALRVGAASHNVYDLALAHLLAEQRGVGGALDVEMLQGMAPAQARAVRDTVGTVILYTPVVAPADFDVAVSYLVRRLEENAQPESFLHALFAGDAADGVLPDQEARFRASVAERHVVPAERRRAPGRPRLRKRSEFSNTTDSDPALDEVREWAAACVTSAPPPVSSREMTSLDDVDDVVGRAMRSHAGWSATPPAERATILRRAADELEARRSELVAVMAAEAGKNRSEERRVGKEWVGTCRTRWSREN